MKAIIGRCMWKRREGDCGFLCPAAAQYVKEPFFKRGEKGMIVVGKNTYLRELKMMICYIKFRVLFED